MRYQYWLASSNFRFYAMSFLFGLLALMSSTRSNAQLDSAAHISIMTCGTGDRMHTLFGHSALRLRDTSRRIDVVFNYGTFNFGTPNFVLKFLRGKLPYYLSVADFDRFVRSYQYQKREIIEQELHLSLSQKNQLVAALYENLEPENRYYAYDFLFDNCTTRLRDIIKDHIEVQYPSAGAQVSFRQMIQQYVSHMAWTSLGIDLILGQKADQIASVEQQMFLPYYFRAHLNRTEVGTEKLVASDQTLYIPPQTTSHATPWLLRPLSLFLLLLAIEVVLFFTNPSSRLMAIWDGLWGISLFICFIIFVFMWWGTDHDICKGNWNILWTLPWIAIFFWRKSNPRSTINLITLIFIIVLLAAWAFLPQQLPIVAFIITVISFLKILRHIRGYQMDLSKVVNGKMAVLMILFLGLGSVQLSAQDKITGITVVAPPEEYPQDPFPRIKQTNCEWVSFIPFAFARRGNPEIFFDSDRQWWGERPEGVQQSIQTAQKHGLHIMLKPQVWVMGDWVGHVDFTSESQWQTWESSYRNYILTFARIAAEYDVEIFCIGTEWRISVNKREAFWRKLIAEVRTIYDGKIVYSANWDDYKNVPFWDALDYVGISAYFPLSEMDTPNSWYLSFLWRKYVKELRKFSKKVKQPILFTEYGYLSVDGAAGKTWLLEKEIDERDINQKAQAVALEALYEAFWEEDFWAGGFLWKWFPNDRGHEGYPKKDYTPKDKQAENVIRKWYQKAK